MPAPPLQAVMVGPERRLDEYAELAYLAPAAAELRLEAASVLPHLAGRTVWLVNSTAQGGGVAEMLPTIVSLLRDLGITVEWVTIGSDEPAFFDVTKHIHNLIHGVGVPMLGDAERALFERVNRQNAASLRALVRPGDIVVVHDPQPLPLGGLLRAEVPIIAVWRSHIGLDTENAATRAAWAFLAPYLGAYDTAVFSAPEYIPQQLAGRASVISPGIDPLTPKNRDLSVLQTVEILCNSGIIPCPGPTVHGPYSALAQRVVAAGALVPANSTGDIGLLTRPIITQVSRWDRLKGFPPLMQAFTALKRSLDDGDTLDAAHRRRIALARLVLAGPEPAAVQDDPEAKSVLAELQQLYDTLPAPIQEDIAILQLPMQSRDQNALMVNALQRTSTIVVQNSLREGFGLTVAEAMWKQIPVLSNRRAAGPRRQLRDGLDGRLITDPEDVSELEGALRAMLADPARLERWGYSAQRRVQTEFLVFTQLREWARVVATLVAPDGPRSVAHRNSPGSE